MDLWSSWFKASVSRVGVGFNLRLREDGGVPPDLGYSDGTVDVVGPNNVAPPDPADVDGLSWGVSSTSGLVALDISEPSTAVVALFPLFNPVVLPILAMKLPRN